MIVQKLRSRATRQQPARRCSAGAKRWTRAWPTTTARNIQKVIKVPLRRPAAPRTQAVVRKIARAIKIASRPRARIDVGSIRNPGVGPIDVATWPRTRRREITHGWPIHRGSTCRGRSRCWPRHAGRVARKTTAATTTISAPATSTAHPSPATATETTAASSPAAASAKAAAPTTAASHKFVRDQCTDGNQRYRQHEISLHDRTLFRQIR